MSPEQKMANYGMWANRSAACFCNNFIGIQSCSFIYILFLAAFLLQQQSWIVATEIIWPANGKILLSCPLQKMYVNPWCGGRQAQGWVCGTIISLRIRLCLCFCSTVLSILVLVLRLIASWLQDGCHSSRYHMCTGLNSVLQSLSPSGSCECDLIWR